MNPSLHFGIEVRHLAWAAYFWAEVLDGTLAYRYSSLRTPGLRTVVITFPQGTLELLCRPEQGTSAGFAGAKNHFSLPEEDLEAQFSLMVRRMEALRSGLDPRTGEASGSLPLKAYLSGASLKELRRTGDGFDEFSITDPEGNTVEFGRRAAEPPRPDIRGVIFDLDGTLLDSEENYYQADRELLARRGVEFSREEKLRCIGLSTGEMMARLKERYTLLDSPERLTAEKNTAYGHLLKEKARLFPKARELARELKRRGYRLGIASGSSAEVVHLALEVTGIRSLFDAVVSSEETGPGKPHPGVFLEAARRLGIPPQHCLVVEDAPAGVEAALEAGMACAVIPSPSLLPGASPHMYGVFSLADLVFPLGGEEWDPEELLAWLETRNAPPSAG